MDMVTLNFFFRGQEEVLIYIILQDNTYEYRRCIYCFTICLNIISFITGKTLNFGQDVARIWWGFIHTW